MEENKNERNRSEKNKKVYRVEGNPSRKNFKEDLRLKFNYEN